MAYITLAQFVARFGQEELSQLLASGSAITFAVAADDASAIIDSYLEGAPSRFDALPLSPIPARILELAGEVTRYKLWGAKASQQVKDRHDAAIKFLEAIADGKRSVPGSSAGLTASGPAYDAIDRVFTTDLLEDYMRDSSLN
tara:strand:+ start:30 stop:458 length:429 start_codon:yes stop_codon:yes gene_type:complete